MHEIAYRIKGKAWKRKVFHGNEALEQFVDALIKQHGPGMVEIRYREAEHACED